MRIVIVDDEKLARDELRFLLEQAGGIEVAGEAENGFEAVEVCRKLKPDVVFLDIQMPGKNGIEAAAEIIMMENAPAIIFQTAYDEFALKAFEVSAADYLLKPISAQRLEAALSRLKERRLPIKDLRQLLTDFSRPEVPQHKPLAVYDGEAIIPLKQEEIIFIEAEGKAVRIVSKKGLFRYNGAFRDIEKKITSPDFLQCHRSYLINTAFVERIEQWFNNTYMLILSGTDEKVPVSRGRMKEFKERLNL
jgi:DNA-binding LytR/AlgR family response regulator